MTMRRFPDGFTVRIRDDVRRVGDLLLGGSPLRAVRLGPAALPHLDGVTVRATDPASEQLVSRLVDGNLADPDLDDPALDGWEVDPAELTVVIPVRDRPEQLARALATLGACVASSSTTPRANRLRWPGWPPSTAHRCCRWPPTWVLPARATSACAR